MVRLALSDSKELLRTPRELPPGELNSEGSLPDIDRLLPSEKDGPAGRLLLIRPFPVVLPNRVCSRAASALFKQLIELCHASTAGVSLGLADRGSDCPCPTC